MYCSLHRTGFCVYSQLCPSHDKNHQTLPKPELISPSPSGIKRNDTERPVSRPWIPDLPSQCSLSQPSSSASTSAEEKDDKSRLSCFHLWAAAPGTASMLKGKGQRFPELFLRFTKGTGQHSENSQNIWIPYGCSQLHLLALPATLIEFSALPMWALWPYKELLWSSMQLPFWMFLFSYFYRLTQFTGMLVRGKKSNW